VQRRFETGATEEERRLPEIMAYDNMCNTLRCLKKLIRGLEGKRVRARRAEEGGEVALAQGAQVGDKEQAPVVETFTPAEERQLSFYKELEKRKLVGAGGPAPMHPPARFERAACVRGEARARAMSDGDALSACAHAHAVDLFHYKTNHIGAWCAKNCNPLDVPELADQTTRGNMNVCEQSFRIYNHLKTSLREMTERRYNMFLLRFCYLRQESLDAKRKPQMRTCLPCQQPQRIPP